MEKILKPERGGLDKLPERQTGIQIPTSKLLPGGLTKTILHQKRRLGKNGYCTKPSRMKYHSGQREKPESTARRDLFGKKAMLCVLDDGGTI